MKIRQTAILKSPHNNHCSPSLTLTDKTRCFSYNAAAISGMYNAHNYCTKQLYSIVGEAFE